MDKEKKVIFLAGLVLFCSLFNTAVFGQAVTHDNVFVLHFEPRSPDSPEAEWAFNRLKEWVDYAKQFNQKFTLGFTPQWVHMILNDPVKLDFVKNLLAQGWDVLGQHHGPHHSWDWDGFSAFSPERCLRLRQTYYHPNPPSEVMRVWYKEREQYNGNINDYLNIMNQIYPIQAMTMGPDRDFDWPSQIHFSMDTPLMFYPSGKPVFDEPVGFDVEGSPAITHFEKKEYAGVEVYECSGKAILTMDLLEAAKKEYEVLQQSVKEDEFLAAILHIGDDENIFKEWIQFLYSKDPAGEHNKTVTEIIRQFLAAHKNNPDTK